ncbi:Putative ribonuclease H protein At1g65750 [Linum perenne]
MEVLSCLFENSVASGRFQLHPQCKGIQLIHLSFADDLLVFTKANTNSMREVMQVLDEFKSLSGLKFNPYKSSIYLAGVDEDTTNDIVEASGFRRGDLPFGYLGVPLTTGKLRTSDCKALLDKITKRVTDWEAKKLSYASRVQLINSVIHRVLQYWMSSFILPSGLIKGVEAVCNRFLWGKLEGKPKVAWKFAAKPKREGEIGIRDMRTWNIANVVNHIWQVLMKAGSLWVTWLYYYRIKRRSFWVINSTTMSWHWKRLLKLRDLIQPHVSLDEDGDVL